MAGETPTWANLSDDEKKDLDAQEIYRQAQEAAESATAPVSTGVANTVAGPPPPPSTGNGKPAAVTTVERATRDPGPPTEPWWNRDATVSGIAKGFPDAPRREPKFEDSTPEEKKALAEVAKNDPNATPEERGTDDGGSGGYGVIPGGSGGSGGGGYGVIPGGMMPEGVTIKGGHPAPEGVAGEESAGFDKDLEAGRITNEGEKDFYAKSRRLYESQLRASADAQTAHADVQARRDAEVRSRLDEIEQVNQQAATQIDPGKFWKDRGTFATVIGTIAQALGQASATLTHTQNGAGAIIDSAINRDIAAQLENRKGLQDKSKGLTSLLGMHLDRFKNEDMAIDSTKLGYYDNVLQQMEAYKADNQGRVSDANFARLEGDLLKRRADAANRLYLQGQNDVAETYRYRPPQVYGGTGGGALPDTGNTIALSDGTSWDLGDSKDANEGRQRIINAQKVQKINDRILQIRKETYELDQTDPPYMANMSELETLSSQKGPLMQKTLDGSVLRESEQERYQKVDAKATTGLGRIAHAASGVPGVDRYVKAEWAAADATIREQQRLMLEFERLEASGAGGKQVKRVYTHDQQGRKQPGIIYTGRNAAPPGHLAPNSFKPAAGQDIPRAGQPLSEDFEDAPDVGLSPAQTAVTAAKRRKKLGR